MRPELSLHNRARDLLLTQFSKAEVDILLRKPRYVSELVQHSSKLASSRQHAHDEIFSPSIVPIARQLQFGRASVAATQLGRVGWSAYANWERAPDTISVRSEYTSFGHRLHRMLEDQSSLMNREAPELAMAGIQSRLTQAETFYSFRDAVLWLSQWSPKLPSDAPGHLGLMAFCVAVDEFYLSSEAFLTGDYIFGSLPLSTWYAYARQECVNAGGDVRWLDLALDSLHAAIILQAHEKAVHASLVAPCDVDTKDWDELHGYFLRCEGSMVAFCAFLLLSLSGVKFSEETARSSFLDISKRGLGAGAGGFAESSMGATAENELGFRYALACSIYDGTDAGLNTDAALAIHRFLTSTGSNIEFFDRYRERVLGKRVPIQAEVYIEINSCLAKVSADLSMSVNQDVSSSGDSVSDLIGNGDIAETYRQWLDGEGPFTRLPRVLRLAGRIPTAVHPLQHFVGTSQIPNGGHPL
ncbi:hypothetical protein PT974_04781 [Cladobotryum mycophilum]|uniref:Uncharacterized protein n=1 Tax=Cladobotryum mycophilum TaxID=491253 RepID=A0ABR0SQC9_9HYPO